MPCIELPHTILSILKINGLVWYHLIIGSVWIAHFDKESPVSYKCSTGGWERESWRTLPPVVVVRITMHLH